MPSKKRKYPQKKAVKKKAVKRKAISKKPLKRKSPKLKPRIKITKEKAGIAGMVTHYFPKVRAAVIKLKMPLAVGETIKIKGHTTDFTQNIASMQIDHIPVDKAKKGQEIGLEVDSRVRQHDIVYKA